MTESHEPQIVYRRAPVHAPELMSGLVVIVACVCVTILGLYTALDATVVSSVLVGAIGWAAGTAGGYRLGTKRATDEQGAHP